MHETHGMDGAMEDDRSIVGRRRGKRGEDAREASVERGRRTLGTRDRASASEREGERLERR
tara:strand:- start:82 stop:264 length:183 start_codon:yes stop_codon:yes gene_type:complete